MLQTQYDVTMLNDYLDLSYTYGEPKSYGVLKSCADDFIVDEIPLVEACGEGEHQFIHIEKKNCTTEQVAKDLAVLFGVTTREVSYAGLKDRLAITRQWFSVHMPGKYFSDIEKMCGDNWRVISHGRHLKKLKTGALKGNQFTIILRELSNTNLLEDRLRLIREGGVPNYFTSQRFGHCGHNLLQAQRMLLEKKKVKNRFLSGLYLSAIRSYLFNKQLSFRVENNTWKTIINGDVLQLSGTKSLFTAKLPELGDLQNRYERMDICPTAILWGRGPQMAQDEALGLQTSVLAPYMDLLNALEHKKVERAYRMIVNLPNNLQWDWIDDNTLQLIFSLQPGSYATAVTRELIR